MQFNDCLLAKVLHDKHLTQIENWHDNWSIAQDSMNTIDLVVKTVAQIRNLK